MIGYNGDSDDDLCNSSPELSEQVNNNNNINLGNYFFAGRMLNLVCIYLQDNITNFANGQ